MAPFQDGDVRIGVVLEGEEVPRAGLGELECRLPDPALLGRVPHVHPALGFAESVFIMGR